MFGYNALGATALGDSPGAGTTTVTADLVGTFDVLSGVTKDFVGSFDVLGTVSQNFTCTFDVLGSVSQNFAGTFDVLGVVTSDFPGTFDVLAKVIRDFAGTFDVLGSVTNDFPGAFDVLGMVSRDLVGTFDVLSSVSSVSQDFVGTFNVLGASMPPLPINPRMLYISGWKSNFSPMRVTEVEVLTIDFGPALAPGETIISASWSNAVSSGDDPNPNAMMQNRCTISGAKVSELFSAHVPGVIYTPTCTVQTSAGQTIILPEYGSGSLYVTG